MAILQSISTIPVRYAETDQMGVVHHSHYPVYFEQGRTDFFAQHLIAYQDLEAQGLLAPVLSFQVMIKGRLTYGDILTLKCEPTSWRGLRLSMGYRGYNKEQLVVEGESFHALTGPGLQPLHPRQLPPAFAYLKERFLAHLEATPS